MDQDLKLFIFAGVLAIGTGALWLRLARVILRGQWPPLHPQIHKLRPSGQTGTTHTDQSGQTL